MTKEETLLESTERYKCNPIIENDKWFMDNDLQIIYDAMEQYHQSKVKENELLHSVSVSDSEIIKESEKLANTSGLLTYTDNEIKLGKVAFINGGKFVRDKLTKHLR